MHELGVLERFVPEFGRLSCKVQHDLYHRFTADIHVLHCLSVLDEIFQGTRKGSQHYLEVLRKKRSTRSTLSHTLSSRPWKRPRP